MDVSTKQIIKMLENYNIKVSYQRIKVLEYLLKNDSHPTADIIYTKLSENFPTISKATVYNTLNLFLEKKMVSSMNTDKFETRYDLLVEPHGHFVCESCGRIFNFPYNYSNLYNGLEGFKITKEEIVLKGICKECKK